MKSNPLISISLLCFVVFILSSCSIFNRNLARRYRNTGAIVFGTAPGDARTYVDVELNSSPVRPENTSSSVYNMLSLSPEGQAQFIQEIAAKATSLTELVNQVTTNFSFSKGVKPNIRIVGNTLKKSLTFTVDRKFAIRSADEEKVTFNNKADRIDFLELQVDLPEGTKATFNDWDKFTSKYATLDLYSAPQILDRFWVNLNWCRLGAELYFSPFPPLLYTTPLAFDSLTIGASCLGYKTGNTHSIRYATPDHLHRLSGKYARI